MSVAESVAPERNQLDDPAVPLTRREALAQERAASVQPTREARPTRQRKPRRQALSRSATLRPAKPARSLHPWRTAGKIAVVTLIAVGVSTPAEALMSSSQVQAKQIAAAAKSTDPDTQVFFASGEAQSVDSDSYDATTKAAYAQESGITRIEDSFTNNPNGTVQWPFAVGVHIGDRYGSTSGRSNAHHGLDFNPGTGAPIQAIADGVVAYAEDGEGDLGVHMMITHVIGGQTVTSVYAHMIHGSMRFKVGDKVKVGQVIGNVGNTGYSTGPHLHFEIRLGGIDGAWTDPLVWLRANTN